MNVVLDPVYTVNLVLCIVILAFGIIAWRRSGKIFPFYIGIAFSLFGVSHLAAILGLKDTLETSMIVVRTLAYVVVMWALYLLAFK